MGIAALVIGIISMIVGFIPFCNYFALIPAIIGLTLGIVDIVLKSKANQPKGSGIAGTVLCSISIVIIILWTAVFGVAFSEAMNSPEVQKEIQNELQNELDNIQIDE